MGENMYLRSNVLEWIYINIHSTDRSGMRSRASRKDNLINSLSDGLRSSNLIEKVNIVLITEELLHVIVLAIESLHTKGGISNLHHRIS